MSLIDFKDISLTIIPVYFYFVPAVAVPRIYKYYVSSTYRDVRGPSLNAYSEMKSLGKSITRLTSFISFSSIYAAVLISILISIVEYFGSLECAFEFTKDIFLILLFNLFFLIAGAGVIYSNIKSKKKFIPSMSIEYLERILVLSSPILIRYML